MKGRSLNVHIQIQLPPPPPHPPSPADLPFGSYSGPEQSDRASSCGRRKKHVMSAADNPTAMTPADKASFAVSRKSCERNLGSFEREADKEGYS